MNSFVLNQEFASSFVEESTLDEVAEIVLDQTMDDKAKSEALNKKGQDMKKQIQDKAVKEGLP